MASGEWTSDSENQPQVGIDGSDTSATLNNTSIDATEMDIMEGTRLEEFIFFNDLPVELRVKIWKYNLPGPRVVPVYFDARGHNLITTLKPPVLLQVCREARLEAQREYPPAFALNGMSTVVPFNFKLDTLYIMVSHHTGFRNGKARSVARGYFKRLPLEDRLAVRSVALDHGPAEALEKIAAKLFPGSSSLIFVDKVSGRGRCLCKSRFYDYRHWSSKFDFGPDTAKLNHGAPFDFATKIFRAEWMRSNGDSSVYTLPQVKVGTLTHNCGKFIARDGGFITLPSQAEKYDNQKPRRSARPVVKKDYKETAEDETEFA